MKRLIEIRFIILLPILILVVGLYLIPPPAAPPPSKILRIDLASESYFVVDKELVNKVFIECENRLKSLAVVLETLIRWDMCCLGWGTY